MEDESGYHMQKRTTKIYNVQTWVGKSKVLQY